MKNYDECYVLENGALVSVGSPIELDPNMSDGHQNIIANGYGLELRTSPETGWSQSDINVYRAYDRALENGKPMYYVEIWGQSTMFAALVAKDFAGLVSILGVAKPLIDLVGLELKAGIHDLVTD